MMALMVEVASVVVTLVVLLVVVVVLVVVVLVVVAVSVVVVLVVVVGAGVVVLGVMVVLSVVDLLVVVGLSVVVEVEGINVVGWLVVVILGHRCWLHFLLILFPPGHARPAPLSLTSSLRVLVSSPPSQD